MAYQFQVDNAGTLMTGLLQAITENGNALDLSGNGRDMTDNNGVAYSGGHAVFDGINDYQRIAAAFLAGLPMSLHLRFKPGQNYPQTNPANLWNQGGNPGAGQVSPSLYLSGNPSAYENNGAIRFYIYNGGAMPDAITTQVAWTSGVTYDLIVTVDSSGNVKIYIDNVDVTTVKTSGNASLQWNANTYIGANAAYAGPDQPYKGDIWDVFTWNKVLSSQERTDLYNGGSRNTLVLPSGNSNFFAFM